MKSIINYYYNLFPSELKGRYGGFLFEIEKTYFLLTEVSKNKEEIMKIYDLLMINQIGNYIIVYNKDSEIITKYEEKQYILYKICCLADEILNIRETIGIKADAKAIWSKIWGDRIDYYEIQINELGQEKLVVLQSAYYYIGLAENAISIANIIEKELTEDDYAVQHYRMNVPVLKGDYFNPNNMLIDISVRDVAEYIKSSFFNNKKEEEDYINYLVMLPLDNKKANLLFARLLYPTYYFDLFDEIILNEKDEEELLPIIKEHLSYEKFLVDLYEQLSLKFNMIYIEWLKKELKAPH